MSINVGIVGTGIYLPRKKMTAKELSVATGRIWSEESIIGKLGIVEKYIPGENDGTQEMSVYAALDCLNNTKVDPLDIDVIICMGEEWKEYPITTTALYVQHKIGAVNAWGIDVQNRCGTTVSALKMAKDMLIADESINTILIVGGYRNCDLIDYKDKDMSMLYNLSAGAGAIILKKNYNKNIILGTHIIADGSLSRDVGCEIGGITNPIKEDNLSNAYKSLKIMNPNHVKERLNEVSMKNWYLCIDKAFEKSGVEKADLGYLAILHIKRSMHDSMLKALNVNSNQTIYLEKFGHMGQVDQILSLHLALNQGKIKEGTVICMLSAGIGYIWAANVIKWGSK